MLEYICTKCHYVGRPRKKKRGSDRTAFMAWLIFPLGIPYTIWRMLTKINICRHCDEQFLVSVNSPTGKKLIEITEAEISPAKPEQKTSPIKSSIKEEEPRPRSTRHQDPNEW